jgi:integrase
MKMMKRRSWLPENVTPYKDRHGKMRYRFRKTGFKTHHFASEPGTDEFLAEYGAAKAQRALPKAVGSGRVAPGTLDDLCARYYASPAFKGMAENSQSTYRGIIERFRERKKKSGRRYGDLPVKAITTANLDAILGAMADTPAAANNLRKVMKRLFRIAVKAGMRQDNPAAETDTYKAGPGFHTWTEEEIEQYRARHPVGSKARLALELLLNTAARRCNGSQLRREQLVDGLFYIKHAKGNDETIVECLDETWEAIEAMPATGIGHFLVTDYGKPFSVAGFGNKMREWCDEADLPHCSAHGLRKAMSRRLAEHGATDAQGRAVTGQKKNQTFAYYAAKANRKHLAQQGLANLKLANRKKEE